MPFFIQRKDKHHLETIDEFPTRKEASSMVREYALADPDATYYISRHCCKAWRQEAS